jgi:excisionase family DNA binding protein
MSDELLTVEKVAELLGLHPGTIRRFVREGRLKAKKVGKRWRILRSELDSFAGVEAAEAPRPGKKSALIRVSSVVDVQVNDEGEAWRISNSVLAVLNGKGPEYGEVRYDYLYMKEERRARLMFWGDPIFIGNLLILLSRITA